MIFIDANVPMYLVGSSHQHKVDAQRMLETFLADRHRMVTDAEVLQEILHRYVGINRREAIQPAFDVLLAIVDEVFPTDTAAVERAKSIVLGNPSRSARDAMHMATMEIHGISRIMSFDSGFDDLPGIERLHRP